MTLPKKEEKGYLEIVARDDGFAVVADKQHASEAVPPVRRPLRAAGGAHGG
jgi:hypothetical protein